MILTLYRPLFLFFETLGVFKYFNDKNGACNAPIPIQARQFKALGQYREREERQMSTGCIDLQTRTVSVRKLFF